MRENVLSAENQQATFQLVTERESSETTRQTPYTHKELLAYLQGAMHDASLNKGKRIRFVQKYPEWLKTLQEALKLLGYNSWMYREGKTRDLYTLETLCKELHFGFDTSELITEKEKAMYLRGFFDAEGGVPRNHAKFYIQLVQKDYRKMKDIKQLLNDLKIESGRLHNPSKRVDPDYWRLFIATKSHRKFIESIGSWHPIKAKICKERMKI